MSRTLKGASEKERNNEKVCAGTGHGEVARTHILYEIIYVF